jgi:hypothetical protein
LVGLPIPRQPRTDIGHQRALKRCHSAIRGSLAARQQPRHSSQAGDLGNLHRPSLYRQLGEFGLAVIDFGCSPFFVLGDLPRQKERPFTFEAIVTCA